MKFKTDSPKKLPVISFKEYDLLKIYINKIWSETVIQYVQKPQRNTDEFEAKRISMCDESFIRGTKLYIKIRVVSVNTNSRNYA